MANINIEDAEDRKLIKAIVDNWGEYLLIFEGGDTVVLAAQQSCCDDEASVVEDSFHLGSWLRYADELIQHGVATEAEVDAAKQAKLTSKQKILEDKIAEVERLKREIERQ